MLLSCSCFAVASSYLGKRCALHADYLDKLKKTGGIKKWKLGIPILEDAKMAATDKSRDCTLILAQGDYAKAFAVSCSLIITFT